MNKNKSYKKAVILGAAGFIGINLSQYLADKGFKIICFDRYISPLWPPSATAITGDFAELPKNLLKELDHALVFHLISGSFPSPYTTQVVDEVKHDVISTIRYIEETKARDLRWIFLSSGGTVYGQCDEAKIKESNPTKPICSYAVAKLAIEQYFTLYRRLHHIDCIIARPANPYGPWQDPKRGQGIISTMLYKALNGGHIDIWGDGENVRDYIYITDTVEGLFAAAFSGKGGETYNIGTAHGLSINQLVRVISETLNVELNLNYSEARNVDVRRNVLSIDKLSAHTGWKPKTSIYSGVKRTAAWLRTL